MRISFWSRLLDTIAPRFCPVCGSRLTVSEQGICSLCYRHLPRTFFWQHPEDNIMARLFWGRMHIERAAALFFFESGSEVAGIVYNMKYHDQPELAQVMGRMMASELSLSGFFHGIDMLVPVPLARKRERQRGYNQSFCIAKGIREATGLPVASRVVRRTAFEKSQTRMSRWERQENVEGVFTLEKPEAVAGKHVLIVDDVVTTGATTLACGSELQKADGTKVSILSLAFTKGI